jgi:hypothetical protein
MSDSSKTWVEVIAATVAAIIAGGFAIKIRSGKKSKSTKTTQTGNKVGGDMAGRDINK